MMKFTEARQAFYSSSAKASDLSRKLCLAGIAVVWVLRSDGHATELNSSLGIPLLLFCGSLFVDLLQYVYRTIVWQSVMIMAGKVSAEEIDSKEVEPWSWINWPTELLWAVKIIVTIIGFVILANYFRITYL